MLKMRNSRDVLFIYPMFESVSIIMCMRNYNNIIAQHALRYLVRNDDITFFAQELVMDLSN